MNILRLHIYIHIYLSVSKTFTSSGQLRTVMETWKFIYIYITIPTHKTYANNIFMSASKYIGRPKIDVEAFYSFRYLKYVGCINCKIVQNNVM